MGIIDFVVLANKKSRGYRDRYRRRLLRIFAGRREAPVIYLPLKEDMFQGVEENIKNVQKVIIAGGDGTFESALNYPPLQRKSLGFFPLGAGNSFYAYFYRGKRFEYLRSRFDFQEIELDVIEIEWEEGKRETLFLSVGLDSEIAKLMKNRTRHGFFDYVGGAWRALMFGKSDYNFKINIDGEEKKWQSCVNITFGKVPYYGYNVRSMLGKIPVNDGLVYGTGCVSNHSSFLNRPLRLWSLILLGFRANWFPLTTIKGREILIKSKMPFPIQAGGEFLGYSKWIRVKVKRKQRVLVI